MKKYTYIAKFEKNINENSYCVTFPDLPGAITGGFSLEEAIFMANDCLGGFLWAMEDDGDKFPKPSKLSAFEPNSDSVFYNLVSIDLAEYRRIHSTKPIKKTLYIPKDLNDKAEAKGINFSQVLREALANIV